MTQCAIAAIGGLRSEKRVMSCGTNIGGACHRVGHELIPRSLRVFGLRFAGIYPALSRRQCGQSRSALTSPLATRLTQLSQHALEDARSRGQTDRTRRGKSVDVAREASNRPTVGLAAFPCVTHFARGCVELLLFGTLLAVSARPRALTRGRRLCARVEERSTLRAFDRRGQHEGGGFLIGLASSRIRARVGASELPRLCLPSLGGGRRTLSRSGIARPANSSTTASPSCSRGAAAR